MEPRIQYAKTTDGVRIAYWTMGKEGRTPLLMTAPAGWSHISLELGIPRLREWYEHLAQDRVIVRYDFRGQGMSDWDIGEFYKELFEIDIAAVVDRLGLERLSLAGFVGPALAAVRYAAAYPERVSKLVLWKAITRQKEFLATPQGQAVLGLLDTDWETYTETFAHQSFGWQEGRLAHDLAAFLRESTSQENEKKLMTFLAQEDLDRAILGKITARTLILIQRTPSGSFAEAAGRDLTSGIADCHAVVLEPGPRPPWEWESAREAFDEFLSEGQESGREPTLPQGTAIILFADIADSTALTEKLGDAAFRTRATGLDGLLRKLIRDASGTPVEGKVLGDGVMAVFSSARQAIDCALRCKKAGDEGGLPLHLGIHAGDVIREGNTVYGGAVNLAQRITDASPAGEILVSDTLRGLARTSTEVGFEDRGEHELRGIPEPQRLFAVREHG